MTQYKLYVTPSALREIKDLPGHVRQRVKRALDQLEENPRPAGSKALDLSDVPMPAGIVREVWRMRIGKWRVLYAVTEAEKVVDVLGVRKRPPYDYGDLPHLLREGE